MRDETGLRTVFHHHCAGYVETPEEIDALMARTDPALVGLCLDSGHATYGGGSPLDAADAPSLARLARALQGLRAGRRRARARRRAGTTRRRSATVCSASSGKAAWIFRRLLRDLQATGFDGWIVVEQDVLPAMGAPLESATRNREYLRAIGI